MSIELLEQIAIVANRVKANGGLRHDVDNAVLAMLKERGYPQNQSV